MISTNCARGVVATVTLHSGVETRAVGSSTGRDAAVAVVIGNHTIG